MGIGRSMHTLAMLSDLSGVKITVHEVVGGNVVRD